MKPYSPGPWSVAKGTAHPWRIEAPSNVPELPCCIVDVSYRPNAHLIAAAPELLEALELILGTTCRELFAIESLEKVYAAIAKAKGEAKP